ncbi:MAG: cytochrome c [Xanthomonadales bacterium]|nr:cytochrome c [Xanthomonadales bacterium]
MIWRWAKRIGLGLLALLVLAVAGTWAASAVLLNKRYEHEARDIHIPGDPVSIAEGERLARVFGCFEACHGRDMQGGDLFDVPDGTQLRSPNLTRLVRERTPAELEAGIRQGVRPDGRSVLAMPSSAFATMSDEHLGQILGFIAAYPEQDNDPPGHRIMPLARFMLLRGEFPIEASRRVPGRVPVEPETLAEPVALGRYLALNTCSECHGLDLDGWEGFTPSLRVVAAYSEEDFVRLVREGLALGGREVGLMSEMGRRRLVHLTDDEVAALYAFLRQAEIPLSDVPGG